MGHTDLGGLTCWWEDDWNIIGDLEIILVFHMALTGDPPVDAAMGNMMIMGLGGIIPVFFRDKLFFDHQRDGGGRSYLHLKIDTTH